MWKRIFLHDPWQKLGALVLATSIWYVAFRHTTATVSLLLPVRPASGGLPPSAVPGEIRVALPEGFVLVDPPTVRLRLRGTKLDLPLGSTVSGIYEPPAAPGWTKESRGETFHVGARDIRWAPPEVARFVDEMEPEVLVLNFERLDRCSVQLAPRSLVVNGEPQAGFAAVTEQARFSPASVTLRGRRQALEPFAGGEPLRLEPLLLAGENATVHKTLGLHPDLAASAFSMEPPSVFVSLPVVPRPTEVRFRTRIELVAFGPGAEERLREFRIRPEDAERDFVLTFRGEPPVPHLDSESAAALVHLFLDLGEIPAEALARGETRFELPLHDSLRLSPEAERAIDLDVRDPTGRRTAVVERSAPVRPTTDGR